MLDMSTCHTYSLKPNYRYERCIIDQTIVTNNSKDGTLKFVLCLYNPYGGQYNIYNVSHNQTMSLFDETNVLMLLFYKYSKSW